MFWTIRINGAGQSTMPLIHDAGNGLIILFHPGKNKSSTFSQLLNFL
jgi:hypothetical protein